MARGGVDYEGIGFRGVTYKATSAIIAAVAVSGATYIEGKAVTNTGNGEAGFGSAGDALLGKVDKWEGDGYVTVQDAGYTTMPGVSGAMAAVEDNLVVNGAGAVSTATTVKTGARAISVDASSGVNTVVVLIG